MPARPFLDTNVLIYAVSQNDPRAPKAEALLLAGGIVSVQVLNEFVAEARRKMAMPWEDVREALEAIRILCPSPIAVSVSVHETALDLAEKHAFSIYDALIAAAALDAGCHTLYSEDFQDGEVIEKKLTVRNPFPG